jgi:hypothetical protein
VPIRHATTPTTFPQLNFSTDTSTLKKKVKRHDVVLITVLLLTLKTDHTEQHNTNNKQQATEFSTLPVAAKHALQDTRSAP